MKIRRSEIRKGMGSKYLEPLQDLNENETRTGLGQKDRFDAIRGYRRILFGGVKTGKTHIEHAQPSGFGDIFDIKEISLCLLIDQYPSFRPKVIVAYLSVRCFQSAHTSDSSSLSSSCGSPLPFSIISMSVGASKILPSFSTSSLMNSTTLFLSSPVPDLVL